MLASAEAPACPVRRGTARDAGCPGQARLNPMELGPLLAVCGLGGGTGTTTLAYLVALAAARQRGEPVLVADTGGPSGGLAALAGVQAPRSLPELAVHLAAGAPLTDGIYAVGLAGIRVLATGPEFSSKAAIAHLNRILADARGAHPLTVIDCGTLGREVDRAAAAAATHLAWVTLATEHGVAQGSRVLDAAPILEAREMLVARCDVGRPKTPLKEVRRLAAERHAALVLVPHLDALARGDATHALEQAQVPIQAILGATLR